MWLVFLAYSPQLNTTFEVRLRFDDAGAWESLVLPVGSSPSCFTGDGHTTARAFFAKLFAAIGRPELAPATG